MGQPTLPFIGFLLSKDSYRIDPAITKAVANFPISSSRTALRSFIGLVNQLSSSTNAFLLAQFRPLLSTKNTLIWSDEFQSAFEEIKTSGHILRPEQAHTIMHICQPTDSHSNRCTKTHGTSYKLAGSRFVSGTESCYTIIEVELLAVTWAMSKFNIIISRWPTTPPCHC